MLKPHFPKQTAAVEFCREHPKVFFSIFFSFLVYLEPDKIPLYVLHAGFGLMDN